MAKKFMIFIDREMNPSIVLDEVQLHKHISIPANTAVRAGGGYWSISKDGTLHLFDESYDFGKYDMNYAQEAFDAKRVSLAEEISFDELKLKKLDLK